MRIDGETTTTPLTLIPFLYPVQDPAERSQSPASLRHFRCHEEGAGDPDGTRFHAQGVHNGDKFLFPRGDCAIFLARLSGFAFG